MIEKVVCCHITSNRSLFLARTYRTASQNSHFCQELPKQEMIYNWHKIIICFGSQKNHHLQDKSSLWKRVEGDSKGKLDAIIRNIFPSNGDPKICVKRWVCWDSGLSVSWSFITLAWIGGRGGHTSTSNTSNTHKSGVFFIPIILKRKNLVEAEVERWKHCLKSAFSAFDTFCKWTTSDESYMCTQNIKIGIQFKVQMLFGRWRMIFNPS